MLQNCGLRFNISLVHSSQQTSWLPRHAIFEASVRNTRKVCTYGQWGKGCRLLFNTTRIPIEQSWVWEYSPREPCYEPQESHSLSNWFMQPTHMDRIVCLGLCALKVRCEYTDRNQLFVHARAFFDRDCDGEQKSKDGWNMRNNEQDHCKGGFFPDSKGNWMETVMMRTLQSISVMSIWATSCWKVQFASWVWAICCRNSSCHWQGGSWIRSNILWSKLALGFSRWKATKVSLMATNLIDVVGTITVVTRYIKHVIPNQNFKSDDNEN